ARLAQRRQQQPDQPPSDAAHVPSIASPNQYLDLLLTDGRGTRSKTERTATGTDAILAGPKPQNAQSQPYSYA
ncbi:hypothetical protein LPJ57_010055, partial [Coemansia sp. RSA 486]